MEGLSDLLQDFAAQSSKKQLERIPQLVEQGEAGFNCLRRYLVDQRHKEPTPVMGRICQILTQNKTTDNEVFLQQEFPQGVVQPKSVKGIDYQPIQDKLLEQDFQAADILTLQKMCELAGDSATKRKWLYFTEVERFPDTDLHTLDQLWFIYSEGKFGFSVQRKLWVSLGKNFNALWDAIAWRNERTWTRYPHEFIWNLDAPKGHLPTSNQLRGAKTITALFLHPVWKNL